LSNAASHFRNSFIFTFYVFFPCRFWTIDEGAGLMDSSRYYYIPEDTLNPSGGEPNTLVVFDELGAAPRAANSGLVYSTMALPDDGMACPL
jgi:hypothetical protein